jgi:hypothetical protein
MSGAPRLISAVMNEIQKRGVVVPNGIELIIAEAWRVVRKADGRADLSLVPAVIELVAQANGCEALLEEWSMGTWPRDVGYYS